MTIQNKKAFMGALWDWGFLDSCFGNTRIRVSDLDGMVERKNRHLVIEGKGPGVPVKKGQEILFASLVKKGFAIIVIWGNPDKVEQMSVWYPNELAPCPIRAANNDDVKNVVRRWFVCANTNTKFEAAE